MFTVENQFIAYLVKAGYKETTPSGKPSTVYDYVKRISRVCEAEGLDWCGLKANIDAIIKEYEAHGSKAEIGAQSHNSVVNALRRFQEFARQG